MNIIERKSVNKGSNSAVGTKGGKFVGAMKRLAKLRSGSRSKQPLQVGNVLTKKAPMGGKVNFDSKNAHGDDKAGLSVQASKGQKALNPKQQ